jgi:hypothetical protein
MIDLKNLINLFPYQYKERDTYKVNGKGILERFLDICGTYLADVALPDVESELDLIDIDNIPEMYLNYLWEFLGEIPFAYGISIDQEKFNKYYNGLKTKEELQALSKVWTRTKSGPVVLSEEKVRNILRFAITLIKIRGTKKFFETLFKLYGFECTVTDPTSGYSSSFDAWADDKPLYDQDRYSYDDAQFDTDYRCNQCIEVTFDISSVQGFADVNSEYFYDSKQILYCGKYDGLLNLYEGVEAYNLSDGGTQNYIVYSDDQETYLRDNEATIFTGQLPASLSDFIAFRRMIESFFERYLPYNVKAKILYQGMEVDDGIKLTVTQLDVDADENTLVIGSIDTLHYKVEVTSYWSGTDTRWQVSSDKVHWGDYHNSGDILDIVVAGTYYIRVANTEIIETLQVTSVILNKWYALEYKVTPGTEFFANGKESFDTPVNTISVSVTGTLYGETVSNGSKVLYSKSSAVNLVLGNYTKKVSSYNSGTHVYTDTYTFSPQDTEDQLGIQKVVFQLAAAPNNNVTINLTRKEETAFGYCSPTSYKGVNISGLDITLRVYTNYEDGSDYVKLLCSNGKYYRDGDVLQPTKFENLTFDVVPDIWEEDGTEETRLHNIRARLVNTKGPGHFGFTCERSMETTYRVTTKYNSISLYGSVSIPVLVTLETGDSSSADYRVKVYRNGTDTGTVLNAADWVEYQVTSIGTYKFESIVDSSKSATVVVTRESGGSSNDLSNNSIVILPEDEDDPNWVTNWEDYPYGTESARANGVVSFKTRVYSNGSYNYTSVEILKGSTLIQTALVEAYVTLEDPGTYRIVDPETGLTALLRITKPVETSTGDTDLATDGQETITDSSTLNP